MPVGAALGYVLGGLMSEWFGWRISFLVFGLPGFLLAAMIFNLPDPRLTVPKRASSLKKDLIEIFKSRSYTLTVFGYCAYTFVVGGVAYWMPAYIQRSFLIDQKLANVYFGGVAVVTGLLGTLVGGYLGDLWAKKGKLGHLKISSLSMFAALPFYAFCISTNDLTLFLISLSLTQFLFFLSTSPINVVILETAPESLKTFAMAMAIFACHILGDAISSPLIGYISDTTGSLKFGLYLCTPLIFLSALIWWLPTRLQREQAKIKMAVHGEIK